jgi:ABC-type cobalt transport system substrate-binding protein
LLTLMLFALASISVIEVGETNSNAKLRNFVVTIFILALITATLGFFIVHWIKYGGVDELEESRISEFYSGLKPFRWARTFNHVSVVRRLILSTLLIFLYDEGKVLKISLITGVQAAFVVYLIALRPFSKRKDNILEMITEIGFLIISASLIYFNKESKWDKYVELAYWIFILLVVVAWTLISISKII